MWHPKIDTAIPIRRYQYGEFQAVLLGEIEASSSQNYLYILAVLREGADQPEVYITCEPQPTGLFRVSVLSANSEQSISETSDWGKEEAFVDFALDGVQQMFGLSDETPVRLL